MVLREWMRGAEARLAKGPHPERARQDAEGLLLHLLGRGKAYLVAHDEEALSSEDAARYAALIDRRLAGEPIQYIVGEQEFFGLPFQVNPAVLIPRPETEGLVERVLELAAEFERPRIVDVGTGSGAIAVTLAKHLPQAALTAVDLSPRALAVARANAERNQVAERIRFVEGDLLAPVEAASAEIVVSNPPYVPTNDRAALAVEVRAFEPTLALFAGADGLDVYRRLIPEARTRLVPGGWLGLEIGYGQAEAIGALLRAAGFESIGCTADLQGIPRVAVGRRAETEG